MLDYRRLGRGLAGTDNLRRYRERTGTNGRDRLWSPEETETLRRLYPDYRAAMKALPGRSYWAVRGHALKHGFARRRHVWTNIELARLRKLAAAGVSDTELVAGFPGLTRDQVIGKLRHHQIKRPRRRFKPTGYPLLDAIRDRCYQLGWSMVDLDEIAGTANYFRCQAWLDGRGVSIRRIAKAVKVLGGTLSVTWKE